MLLQISGISAQKWGVCAKGFEVSHSCHRVPVVRYYPFSQYKMGNFYGNGVQSNVGCPEKILSAETYILWSDTPIMSWCENRSHGEKKNMLSLSLAEMLKWTMRGSWYSCWSCQTGSSEKVTQTTKVWEDWDAIHAGVFRLEAWKMFRRSPKTIMKVTLL